jgi:hypothetical protein
MNTILTPPSFDSSYVQPLGTAENQFLQVLVDRFRIQKKGNGFDLQVAINDDSPAIWLREAKRKLRATLQHQHIEVQKQIDEFFSSNDEFFNYHNPSFPFRLGNGGTLPVVRMKGNDYFCLFYRDSLPIGWNIANGGANTRHDIMHPDAIIERELREELIIVEPERNRWYVFDWHDARLRDHPDFAIAQKLWKQHFSQQGFSEFEIMTLPLKWSIPPDAGLQLIDQCFYDTIHLRYGDDPAYTGQGFLNINAEDFGIEFDRIAKLNVSDEAIFCDGELRGNHLLNRAVGLFSVERMLKEIKSGQHHFVPDRLYWNGENRTDDDPKVVIEAFLKRRNSSWAQIEENLQNQTKSYPLVEPFDLCPVTRTIIMRYSKLREASPTNFNSSHPFEVFISFASEDKPLAKIVFDHIRKKHQAFFSDVTLTSGAFADQIDHALDSARAFIAVGSQVKHLEKSWVKYEWRNFHNDTKSGRKPEDSPFFAFVSGVNPNDLPRPLREQSAVSFNANDPTPALGQLNKLIKIQ